MIRYSTYIVILLAAGLCASAEQKSLDQLKVDAEKANGGHQAQLYGQLAQLTVEVADQQFTQGDSVQGLETVKQVLVYATRAHDISLETRKKMKEVEIHLRETQRRMASVRRTLAADDRPELEAAEKKLADFRQDLLNAMFAPKKKKEESK